MQTQSSDAALVPSSELSVTLGHYAHHIIRRSFQKILASESAVFKDQDPEPLHQMRVGMRQLRTALQVFGPAIALPPRVSPVSVGKIAKGLGETRDLDVLHQVLTTRYQPLLPKPERAILKDILKHLHQTRRDSFLHLKHTLRGDRYHHLKQALQTWVDHPTPKPMGQVPLVLVLPDLLLPPVCQLFLHPGWLVGTTVQTGHIALLALDDSKALHQQGVQLSPWLHSLRKQTKGVRYPTEFFSDFYADAYHNRIGEFKQIQEILGQFQDQTVLRQFLDSKLQSPVAQALPTIELMMQQEHGTFWQTWQPWQQRYLAAETREFWRSLITTPLNSVQKTPPPLTSV